MAISNNNVNYIVNLRGNYERQFSKLTGHAQKTDTFMSRAKATAAGFLGAQVIGNAARQMGVLAGHTIKMGLAAEGVSKAFNSAFSAEQMKRLRRSTGGLVNDLELMKLAMQARNFKIPLDTLALGLEFARKRAQETGQSTDYLVNSFVAGLGRKSALVLDNLGISLTEIQKEVKKVGDFNIAVGNIIRREMGTGARVTQTASEKFQAMRASVQNVMIGIGQRLVPVIVNLVEKLQTFVRENEQTITAMIKLTAVIGGLAAAFLILSSPITLIVVAIGAVVYAVYELVEAFPGLGDAIDKVWDGFKTFFANIGEGFGAVMDIVKGTAKGIIHMFDEEKAAAAADQVTKGMHRIAGIGIKVRDAYNQGGHHPLPAPPPEPFTMLTRPLQGTANRRNGGGGILEFMNSLKGSFGGTSGASLPNMSGLAEGGDVGQPGSGLSAVVARAPKTFNINIDKLVEMFTIETTNIDQAPEKIKDAIIKALLDGINDTERLARNTGG